jgi:predicted nucleic acid-binding protein
MGLSCLSDQAAPIVGDTSTIINLNATGCASAILRAVPNRFIITDVVLDELREDGQSKRNDAQLAAKLIEQGLITVVEISSLTGSDFEHLVAGTSAATLDDGEAATIAYASEKSLTALIDEKKATKICKVQYPKLLVGSTGDLLALKTVEARLGRASLADAAYEALTGARMRVLPQHLDWIVELIGPERVGQCESLPKRVRSPQNSAFLKSASSSGG